MRASRIAMLTSLGLLSLAPQSPAVGPLQFYSIAPCRMADTRDPTGPTGGPPLTHGVVRAFPVFGQFARPCGIPSTAKAVAVNAAIVQPPNGGHFVMFANNSGLPSTSNINFNLGEIAIANGALVKLTYPPSELVDPNYQLAAMAAIAGGGTVHLVLGVTGYYQ